ncbi:MAG: EAL domain-containing protein [Nitrospira sp.]|nr:EAL domain-containing protein [Nitrospira sp.]
MRLHAKLVAGYFIMAVLAALVGSYGIVATKSTDKDFEEVIRESIPELLVFEDMKAASLRIVSSSNEYGFLKSVSDDEGDFAKSQEKNLLAGGINLLDDAFFRYKLILQEFPEELSFEEDLKEYAALLIKVSGEMISALEEGVSNQRITAMKEEQEKYEEAFLQEIEKGIAHEKTELSDRARKVKANIHDAIYDIWLLCILLFVVAICTGLFVAGRIAGPIRKLTDATARVGRGELQLQIESSSKDEVGKLAESFNQMTRDLKSYQDQIRNLSHGVEQSPVSIVIVDLEGNVEYANPKSLEYTGISFAEVQGRSVELLDLESETDSLHSLIMRAVHSLSREKGVIQRKRSGGEFYWESVTVSPIRNSDNIITQFIAIMEDITLRKQAEDKLQHKAYHDSLTGLPNRLLFTKKLKRNAERRKRNSEYTFAVLFIDLDRFKIINDSFGHTVGDKLLIEVGRKMKLHVRANDVVARFGGDEFVLLLDDIKNADNARQKADKILQDISQTFKIEGHDVYTSASIGIAISSEEYSMADDVLRDADSAMYHAKALGKARYELFDNSMHTSIITSLDLENDLKQAIVNDEFELHYQPVISLQNGRITGIEAIIRWNHPKRGQVLPAEFIPLAEETGQIIQIGAWVLKTACAQQRLWYNAGHAAIPACINISSRQFHNHGFIPLVRETLQETGLPADCLTVEITESMAMDSQSLSILHELKSLGVRTSIDDFGIGHSSLSALKQLPVHAIKIGRTFTTEIGLDPNVEAIIRAIILMGHSFKMIVMAIGAETEEHVEFLRTNKCDMIQGYLFSRPVQAEEMTLLLQDEHEQRAYENISFEKEEPIVISRNTDFVDKANRDTDKA